MSRRYNLTKLKKAIEEPSLLSEVPGKVATDIRDFPLNTNRYWYRYRYGGSGEDFIGENWDNLLILDAARPDIIRELDIFEESFVGDRWSPASYSLGFMRSQFVGRELHDTVYVTANPHVHDIPDGIFHKVVNLLEGKWNEQYQTVLPGDVVSAATSAFEEHPNKRLIVHFMQPHFPFIGESGRDIPGGIGKQVGTEGTRHPWKEQMRHHDLNHESLIEAYRENHEIAANHAKQLVKKLPGKSVITADHANLIGERGFPIPIRMYGHPKRFPHPNLLRVPWVVFEDDHREIISEPPQDQDSMADDIVEDRLEALGYT